MSALRRYEMLLPQSFNDGTAVPREFFAEVLLELRSEFGAVSSETQVIQGVWEFQGAVFHEDLIRVFVDVPDTPRHREFFLQFKERLKGVFSNWTFGSQLIRSNRSDCLRKELMAGRSPAVS